MAAASSAQIYDHYFCNFETFDQSLSAFDGDTTIQRFIFIHGRCKGDLRKPHIGYAPLLRTMLASLQTKYAKKAIIYMPEYHEYVGFEMYEPWSLKFGPISRNIRESVLWQIQKWQRQRFSFITNSWGCWHTIKLLSDAEIASYVDKVTFVAPVFNCWLIEEPSPHYVLNNGSGHDQNGVIEVCGIYGSNDMQCGNDSRRGGVETCLAQWFDQQHLRVICIEGGTHGGIYDAIPNAKWNRRKWIIGGSTQKYYDFFAEENGNGAAAKEYEDKISKYEEPELPNNMNEQQYREKIANCFAMFMFAKQEMKSKQIRLSDSNRESSGMRMAITLLTELIKGFDR